MTKLETSITQNGDKIALKVDEQKFNASRKTLSQVISEISATTKGINLSYDENGNIQSTQWIETVFNLEAIRWILHQ